MDHVRWDPHFDGKTITIRNVKNLRIVGVGPEPARLLVRPRYVFVLRFEDCQDVTVENLVLGHTPEGVCDAGVVAATRCAGLTFRKADLFGCGTEGLTLEEVENFLFQDSIVRDCTYGIMTIEGCRDLRLEGSQFLRNREYWAVQIRDSRDVLFTNCRFVENEAGDPLFNVASSSAIRVKDGAAIDNRVPGITNNANAVTFENVEGL